MVSAVPGVAVVTPGVNPATAYSATWSREHDPGCSAKAHPLLTNIGSESLTNRLSNTGTYVPVGITHEPCDRAKLERELDGFIDGPCPAHVEFGCVRFATHILKAPCLKKTTDAIRVSKGKGARCVRRERGRRLNMPCRS